MRLNLIATGLAFGLATMAQAQEGAYFGVGLGATASSGSAAILPNDEFSATDYSVALTAGYRFAAIGNLTYGIEGNLDLMGGNRMSTSGGSDTCTNQSPSWCEVDAVLRLRGTFSTSLANGARLTTSLGAAVVRGLAEDGPDNYVDATGRGLSLGIAWEQVGSRVPVRVDLNYDAIHTDDANLYDRDLNMLGLRVSYLF